MKKILLFCFVLVLTNQLVAQKTTVKSVDSKSTEIKSTDLKDADLSTFKLRPIGPAFMSGRIIDLAINPDNVSEYYVAVASGGVYKTTNNGVTYEPIFESYGSFSIGCVTIDPTNSNVVWVGTGEANNQRSVAFGDGVYKSEDGGKSFTNMGLKTSNHIGEIIVDPKNPDIIYVAAYGPLWDSGGERGVYKSVDGGKTWSQSLKISEHTGVADIAMDPRDSKVLYASAHQRQRKGYGYVSGGPESALYKTTNGGETWSKINKGLPSVEKGRIAIAISPMKPDVLYAHLEAQDGMNGSYRSSDRGASWVKVSSYSSSGLYYGKIFPDPVQFDRIYVGDVIPKVSDDGGRNYSSVPLKNVHVDDHTFYINPKDNSHMMLGGDGGLYETWNGGGNWHFKSNISVTQFYRVATDNDLPFYNVYGGTQDNSSIGGPSRTTNSTGIVNSDWYLTNGGDGFESQVDWSNPNIVYAQSQHGYLVRFDKKTGETTNIKPAEMEGEPALRWNWDSPLVLSSFKPERLYFGANKVYRTDDRGNTWKLISPDLSRQVDRNTFPYMGKVWSVDAVQKNTSTSIFGQTTSISESKLDENILYVGTDDGLIQITTDGGKTWTKVDDLPGVPKMSYIPHIVCSQHDKNIAYVIFNHHRYGDYKPYVLKTSNGGKSWDMITNNLPARLPVYTIAEDHVDPNILFIGTEFGLYTSLTGGQKWQSLKNGLPVIAVKDLEIQKRENDLVLATFGRGFYILDDYSAMRNIKETNLSKAAYIFPIKDAWIFNDRSPLGGGRGNKNGTQGDSYWSEANPPVGAIVKYFVKEIPSSIKAKRKKMEKEMIEKGTLKGYTSIDSMMMEENELSTYHMLTIYDSAGDVLKRIKVNPRAGMNEYVWNFTTINPSSLNTSNASGASDGMPVIPGKYMIDLSYFDGTSFKSLSEKTSIIVKGLGMATLPAKDLASVQAFAKEAGSLAKVIYGTSDHLDFLVAKHATLKAASFALPKADVNTIGKLNDIEKMVQQIKLNLNGNSVLEAKSFETLPGIKERLSNAIYTMYGHSSDITATQRGNLALAKKLFTPVYAQVKKVDADLNAIQKTMEALGSPYIQGSMPVWKE